MRMLVFMKLSNRSLEHQLTPIISLKTVDKIIVVRDKPGPKLKKIQYASPSRILLRLLPLNFMYKLLQGVAIGRKENVGLIHGYLLFPHGILALIAGKITHKKTGVSLIAGPVEVYGPITTPVGKYPYTQPLSGLGSVGRIFRGILSLFDVITVTGHFTRKELIKLGLNPRKLFILPHEVDERFHPSSTRKVYDVIYVGRLAKVKHVEILLQALSQVILDLPEINCAIIGDGPELDSLKRMSAKLGIQNNVQFVGYRKDVERWYNMAKVSVITSEREGFPYSAIEALKSGTALITSACGDISDTVVDRYNGLVVPHHDDVELLSQLIKTLLDSPKIRKKLEFHSIKSMKHRYISGRDPVAVWDHVLKSVAITEEEGAMDD